MLHFESLIRQIKNRREELQITQEQLADIAEVGVRTLKAFESGKGNPTLQTVNALANALGLELCFQIKQISTNE
ncbi:MAG: helix-turn-helix domain-containing protein [Flavobacteriaceae bacterium]